MTEQQPSWHERVKIRLVSIWTVILSGVREAGRQIMAVARYVVSHVGSSFGRLKNHTLPAVGLFFTRHIRQAKNDIDQLTVKLMGPAKARAKQAKKTTASQEETDDYAVDETNAAQAQSDNRQATKSDNRQATISFNAIKNQTTGTDSQTKRLDIKAALNDDNLSEDQTLTPQQKSSLPAIAEKRRRRVPPIRRKSRQRVYRLVGYTTVAKVNRKHQAEMQQQFLRKFLIYVAVILMIVILFRVYNPFRDLTELYRILGISDLSEFAQNSPLIPDATPTPRG